MTTQDQPEATPVDFQVIRQDDGTFDARVSLGFNNHEDGVRCHAEMEVMLTSSEGERGYVPTSFGLYQHSGGMFVVRIKEKHDDEFDAEIGLVRLRRLMSEIAREVSTDATD